MKPFQSIDQVAHRDHCAICRVSTPLERAPRVYLAGPWARQSEIANCKADLASYGIEVTSRWLIIDHQTDNTDGGNAKYALEDLEDVDRADCVISFTEGTFDELDRVKGSVANSLKRGGRHVEFGYAVAKGKEVWVVGPRENIFHHLPNVRQFDTWVAVIAAAHNIRVVK